MPEPFTDASWADIVNEPELDDEERLYFKQALIYGPMEADELARIRAFLRRMKDAGKSVDALLGDMGIAQEGE